jgi:hemolysin activation/secretion protein
LAQLSGAAIEQQQLQRQQERERELRERMAPNADTLQPRTKAIELEMPKSETPCFALHTLELTGEKLDQVPWLKAAAGIDLSARPCVGAKGVEVILARLQQAVLEHGYVTSRVMVVPQNLQGGVLTVAFIPGVLRSIRFTPDSTGDTSLIAALPSNLASCCNCVILSKVWKTSSVFQRQMPIFKSLPPKARMSNPAKVI